VPFETLLAATLGAPLETTSHFIGETLDDLMRDGIKEIQKRGEPISPSRGPCSEIVGVMLELTNPRARLSRTETRGRPFSCLGELCWYLAGSRALSFIEYYVPAYSDEADGDVVEGGYGPRLMNWKGVAQLHAVTELLKAKQSSRQAVIQLFDACDLAGGHRSPPCTCTLQFFVRGGRLHMVTYMRSNDVYIGLPHDVFAFTMIQEIMAQELGIDLGWYKHIVGSLHLYDARKEEAQQFLDEGWQPTDMAMPPMPPGEPRLGVRALLAAEEVIRVGDGSVEVEAGLDPYWADLIRLLQVLKYSRVGKPEAIEKVDREVVSATYRAFIARRLAVSRERSET
jgi:thymidylate synthase